MHWYRVVKTIKGHRYVYLQRTWREGKRVRTESRYVGPAGEAAGEGSGAIPGLPGLPAFTGAAWRAETGLLVRGKTALEVVEFEESELGNVEDFKHLTPELRQMLATLPASAVVWVTRSRKDAARYGEPERIDLGPAPMVLAADGDGGFLILKGPPAATTRKRSAEAERQ